MLRVIRENSVLCTLRTSHGSEVSSEPVSFRILRNQREQTLSSIFWLQPYILSCQGAKPFMVCGGSYDSLSPIRWSTKIIIQWLNPLVYKDFVFKVERVDRFYGHRVLESVRTLMRGCHLRKPQMFIRPVPPLKASWVLAFGSIHPTRFLDGGLPVRLS